MSRTRSALMLAGVTMVFVVLLAVIGYFFGQPPSATTYTLPTPPVNHWLTCDDALRDLITRSPANYGINGVTSLILRVQTETPNCTAPAWDPIPINAPGYDHCGTAAPVKPRRVDNLPVPDGLIDKTPSTLITTGTVFIPIQDEVHGLTEKTKVTLRGDAIIHWSPNNRPPGDHNCWLRNALKGRWAQE